MSLKISYIFIQWDGNPRGHLFPQHYISLLIKHICKTQILELAVMTQKGQDQESGPRANFAAGSCVKISLKSLALKQPCCHLVHDRIRGRTCTHLSRLKNKNQ